MYLRTLKLWNFRKYGSKDHLNGITKEMNPDLTVEFKPDLNVLIGENDSGKTAIIDAIKYVLNSKSLDYFRIEEKDFYQHIDSGKRATELRIECVFRGFSSPEAGSFLEWVGFDSDNNYVLTIWLTASRTRDNRIITNIRAGQDDEGIQLDGEARENLKVTYLKPLRDALTELTPGYKSRIAQILGGHNIFKSKPTNNPEEKWKHELENKAKEANDVIRTYFKPSTEKNINEIKEELEIFSQYVNSKKDCIEEKEIKGLIDQFKQTFDKIKCGDKTSNEGAEITKQVFDNLKALSFDETINDPAFEITDEELSDILKTLKLVNDSNKAGLGSLNRLYMAAEFLLLSQSKGRELQLALIEEIEAHLHPQAQLKVIDALQNDDHLKKGQKILTTHSTTLASKVKLNNLLLCHNKDVYSMFNDEKHTRLGVGDYEFLERFLDATKANLFFAKGVIMVEGDAENLLIPAIAEIIDRPLQNYGVSIVNVGSTAFMRYAKIFQRNDNKILGIYVACVRDLDIKQTIDKNGKVITPKRKSGKEEYTPHVESEIEKKKEIEDDAVLVFTSPLWTLEHDLLNSDEITRQLLLQSILEAQLIQNREDQKNYKSINEEDEIKKKMISEKILDKYKEEGKANNWIACKIYSKYLDNNRVSKTITAQRFAYHLLKNKSKVKNIIQNATEFEYIRDTIYFVTKDSES